MNKNFYLENINIKMNVGIEKKKINTNEIDWFTINEISGTETRLIEEPVGHTPSKIQEAYDVNYIPSTYLVDEEGTVIAFNPSLEKINTYLKEKLKSKTTTN